jgi:ketosteroid isomerase-like protein
MENITLVKRLHEAFNRRDFTVLDEILAPDFYSHSLKVGAQGVKQSYINLSKLLPDARVVDEDLFADGDKVACRTRVDGVPALADGTQPFIMEIMRIENGKIIELWGLTNMGRSS